jgi:diaminopimelate epimerase
MRYFNADGSFGSMCGNGGRCAGRYAFDRGYCPEEFVFESLGHAYRAVVTPGGVSLHMKDIAELPRPVSMETVNGQQEPALFLDTGSPHVVLPVEQVQHQDVVQLGRMIRHKTLFGTGGTNVDFIEKLDANSLALRTYERGVEAETMACGTGAVAAAITGWFALDMKPPILVRTQGGEVLAVRFTPAGSGVTNVVLEGSAHMLFDGTTVFDDVTGTLQKPTAEDYRAR